MADIDDLRLNEPASPAPAEMEPPARRPSLLAPIVIIALIIGVGAAVLLWPKSPPPAPPPPKAQALSEPQVVTSTVVPHAIAGDDIPLPPLDETDPLVRQLVSQLSSHPRVAAWLATQGLLRNLAVVVANIADGTTPVKVLRSQRPAAPFSVRETPNGSVIDPAGYQRYDGYADAVAGLDARGTAKLYETLKPRIADAYKDLGYPDADVDGALTRAIIVLLRTPRVSGDIAVTRSSVTWKYADPALESLPGAQKQLLRMGPRNEQIIQDKLRDIAPYLGIDPAKLPAQTVGSRQ